MKWARIVCLYYRMDITIHARKLVYDLLALMPSPYQRASLKAMLALFLCAQGAALPEHTAHKSPSALRAASSTSTAGPLATLYALYAGRHCRLCSADAR